MTLGERVRKRREKLGLSQRELARVSGISQPTISNIERGAQEEVTTAVLRPLARALNCSADYLIGMYEEEETELYTAMAS
jgi:transcriptional regulator with XRE-family HTH domain